MRPSRPPSEQNQRLSLWPSVTRAAWSSGHTLPERQSSTKFTRWGKPGGSRSWGWMRLSLKGANIGTRFLASEEASADDSWKRGILATESEDVIRFEVWREIFPPASEEAYETVPRVMPTSFVEEWQR